MRDDVEPEDLEANRGDDEPEEAEDPAGGLGPLAAQLLFGPFPQ